MRERRAPADAAAWPAFPYPDPRFAYSAASLKRAWHRLHAGDAEPWPHDAALVEAWIAFHAGRFEEAAQAGLAQGVAGYAVANKATCMHAAYLEPAPANKGRLLLEVAARCERQQAQQPDEPAGFYWHAYALGRHAQDISVIQALSQGIGGKVRASLEKTLALAPRHADAHVAFGVWHAEIIDKTGALAGRLTYGANRTEALAHFEAALDINPGSAITRVEYARALVMLDGRARAAQALALCREAAAAEPHDATERLDIERARQELGD